MSLPIKSQRVKKNKNSSVLYQVRFMNELYQLAVQEANKGQR